MILGGWIYCHRDRDIWFLLGVTGLVTRFWTYHGWYDDLLILPSMIALFRTAKRGTSPDGADVIAGTLLGMSLCVMIAPGGQYLLPPPWNRLFMNIQMVVWILVLIFLLVRIRRGSPEPRKKPVGQ